MDLGLRDRVAVVLASSDGLGLSVARSLAAEGARVAISGRDPGRLERARAALAAEARSPEHVLAEPLDVTAPGALEEHLRRVADHWDPVQVLVTNAGGPPPASAADVDEEGLRAALELTLASAVRAVRAVLPGMRAARWGRVVALTSISVRQPIPSLAYSNVMRAGLTAWLKTLATQVGSDGVLVNSVCTGLFATDRLAELFEARAAANGTTPGEEQTRAAAEIPLGRIGDPREFGDLVAFLCSERCSYLTGVALPYDGGLDRALL